MDSKRFLGATFGLAAVLAGTIAVIDVQIDFYGVFGRDADEPRHVVSNDRATKYMHTFRYVPSRFDGMLLGSSVCENLDTSLIPGHRVYNACLGGGDGTEEAILAANALDHGARLRLVLVSLDGPTLGAHGRRAGGMEPRDRWGAFGSMPLLRDYVGAGLIRAGLWRRQWDAFGVQDYEISGLQRVDLSGIEEFARGFRARQVVKTDDEAIRELGELLARVRAQGGKVIGFRPPVHQVLYRIYDFEAFDRRARALLEDGEPFLDFNTPAFAAIHGDVSNFIDGVHLSRRGASKVMGALVEAMRAVNEAPLGR